MLCLGIESTAHTLGIGIANEQDGKISVLSNARDLYKPQNEGIIPRKAADHHGEVYGKILHDALTAAHVSLSDVGLFSFSQGPGIGQCLRTGCAGARFLSSKYKKPVLGINHCQAHLEVSRCMLCMESPLFVYISGGNTQIIIDNRAAKKTSGAKAKIPKYSILGETLDIGIGNLFDSFARNLKLEYAHGSVVAKLASGGKYIELPYTVKGMNFAFTGLLTAASKKIGQESNEDLCHSVMHTAFAEICEASERALCLTGKKEVLACGGVAQNAELQKMLSQMCEEHGARFGVAANEYNADNGAMIAYTALLEQKRGARMKLEDCKIRQDWRIDEIF
jgi:glycoprotease/Kae1 family metallohydrolase